MIVGLSGVRADVIPFAMAHGPLAHLIGLNVVGLRRRGLSRSDLHKIRDAYHAIFGDGTFAERVKRAEGDYGGQPLAGAIFDFIRTATRPLTMAVHRGPRRQRVSSARPSDDTQPLGILCGGGSIRWPWPRR